MFISAVALNGRADTVIYDDGVWRVSGLENPVTNANRIAVSVGSQPSGSFTELRIYRSYAGGFPQVYLIQAEGVLTPAVPPNGDLGGTFHLTGYWDCYVGQRLDVRITSLNLQPNTGNTTALKFTGTLSNGTSLQASDLRLKLQLKDDSTVQLNVRYTLYATSFLCIDPYRQTFGEGFQFARIASNFVSDQIKANDGARAKTVIGQNCGCCGCNRITGFVCANFVSTNGYVYPYPVRMVDTGLYVSHGIPGPLNTTALTIDMKNPRPSSTSAQGYLAATTDPAVNNVDVWVNWDKAQPQYSPGQKVRAFQFNLIASVPEPKSCDLIVP
jgi:hypothetical protein